MANVFVTRRLPGPALSRLCERHDTVVWEDRLPPPATVLAEYAAESDGLLTLLTDRIDAALIASSPRLVAISNYATGVDNIDLSAAGLRGIPVGHTPGVLTEASADLTFGLLLAAARQLPEAIREAPVDWVTWEPGRYLGASVSGATLGIIGFGRIGQAVARRATGFNMNIVHTIHQNGKLIGLEQVLSESDFVSLHCPLTEATHHLINEAALTRMKSTAILVNTARGGIVDQRALRAALEAGAIAGAALDVTDPEPLPATDPLWAAPNLTIVPHIGSATRETREQMAEIAVENLLAALDGKSMAFQAGPARPRATV